MAVLTNGAPRPHMLNVLVLLHVFFKLCLFCLHMLRKSLFLYLNRKTVVSCFKQLSVIPKTLSGSISDQWSVNHHKLTLFRLRLIILQEYFMIKIKRENKRNYELLSYIENRCCRSCFYSFSLGRQLFTGFIRLVFTVFAHNIAKSLKALKTWRDECGVVPST